MNDKGIIILVLVLSLSVLGGCGSSKKQVVSDASLKPLPKARISPSEQRPTGLEAGLFRERNYGGFFQDLRAFKVGDLVTVNIVETSKASKKASTKTERTSSIEAGIENLLGYETKFRKWGNLPRAFDNATMFKGSISNKFDGSGFTIRDESMTASITAMVVEVLPNGNLVIRGSREIRVNNETQFIVLSGIIRPVDISPDNTILSSYIANAKIEYTGRGPISDKQRPGWLARLIDFVWPF